MWCKVCTCCLGVMLTPLSTLEGHTCEGHKQSSDQRQHMWRPLNACSIYKRQ